MRSRFPTPSLSPSKPNNGLLQNENFNILLSGLALPFPHTILQCGALLKCLDARMWFWPNLWYLIWKDVQKRVRTKYINANQPCCFHTSIQFQSVWGWLPSSIAWSGQTIKEMSPPHSKHCWKMRNLLMWVLWSASCSSVRLNLTTAGDHFCRGEKLFSAQGGAQCCKSILQESSQRPQGLADSLTSKQFLYATICRHGSIQF